MEEKRETKSGSSIRKFSCRIRKTVLDLITGTKQKRRETGQEYEIKQEIGKEERKEKMEQLQMRTAAGVISLLCFCYLPVIAAETMQPEGILKTATASEATVSEAGAFGPERETASVQTQSHIADGFHMGTGRRNLVLHGCVRPHGIGLLAAGKRDLVLL